MCASDVVNPLRVLIHAPVGRDAGLTAELLQRASIACHVCHSLPELCEALADGAGAILLTEEALSNAAGQKLAEALEAQPAWSDISVLLFAGNDREPSSLRAIRKLEILRNVTLLERPVRVTAVISTVQAALRGRQRQYELRDVLGALHRARGEAESANRLKDEFLATLSHELRTPLNAILGWVSMLRQNAVDPDDVARVLGIVERNAAVQVQLIADVLDVSRMITGKIRLRLEPTPLAQVAQDAIDSVMPGADAKGVTINLEAVEPLVVNGDRERLQQVLWNLLSNAVKFTSAGGNIRVGLARSGGAAEMTVADSGIGLPRDFLPFAFDRFRQADQSFTRSAGGLGLGLAIVKHLVEMHGGDVAAESDGPGTGAVFRVRLPLAVEPATSAGEGGSSLAASSLHAGENRAREGVHE
jgi:signal transduction histidine kinase